MCILEGDAKDEACVLLLFCRACGRPPARLEMILDQHAIDHWQIGPFGDMCGAWLCCRRDSLRPPWGIQPRPKEEEQKEATLEDFLGSPP